VVEHDLAKLRVVHCGYIELVARGHERVALKLARKHCDVTVHCNTVEGPQVQHGGGEGAEVQHAGEEINVDE
jgi:hypothetical protein